MIKNILYSILNSLYKQIEILKDNKIEYVYNVVMLIYINIWIVLFLLCLFTNFIKKFFIVKKNK